MNATNGIADGTNGITLLPCPVCGCIEAVRETLYLTDIPVLCCGEGCGFSVFLYKDSSWDELERVWNTRWHPKPTDAVREFAEHVAEDVRRRESKAWMDAAMDAVADMQERMDEARPIVNGMHERIAELETERDALKAYIDRKEHIHNVLEKDRRIRELEAENAKLNDALNAATHVPGARRQSIRIAELESLVRDMWAAGGELITEDDYFNGAAFYGRMRELGIEAS